MSERNDIFEWVLLLVLCLLMMAAQSACTRTIYAPETLTEYRERVRTDSVYLRDSVYVLEQVKGDTIYVFKDRWRIEYRDQLRIDTISRVDSIAYPVEVERIVYRTPGIAKWLAWIGGIAIVAGIALILLKLKRII